MLREAERSTGVNMLRHLGRPSAEFGRDGTQVIDQLRRPEAREARERAEPSAHRLIVLSPRSYRAKRPGVSRSSNPETSR